MRFAQLPHLPEKYAKAKEPNPISEVIGIVLSGMQICKENW